jgi:anti-sigma factor RsiW
MTSAEARELFSAAADGELDDARAAELREALAADPQLQRDFAAFEATLALMHERADDVGDTPDLLTGVQERLRARSRGRYYGDRFARRRRPGLAWPLLLGVAMLGVLGLLWFCVHMIESAQLAP